MKKIKKKICIISSTRADFGLLWPLAGSIKKNFLVTFLLTGTHFIKSFGEISKELKKNNGIKISRLKVNFYSDKNNYLVKLKNDISQKLCFFLKKQKPDLVIILGDRFEILECAFVSYLLRIPIAHIHGGEITNGSYDDSIRHAITKLSNLHFVSHINYKKRVEQLGETNKNVFCIGSPGISALKKVRLKNKHELEHDLKIKFNKKNLTIVYHPINSVTNRYVNELKAIFDALKEIKNTSFFFTYPGLENGFLKYRKMLKKFVKNNKNCFLFKSLGHKNFLSLISCSDALLGNSSSGIIEVATLKKPVINIGNRQSGRVQSSNIINCIPQKKSIIKSIQQIYAKSMVRKIKSCKNVYDKGDSFKLISDKLSTINFSQISLKKFIDK